MTLAKVSEITSTSDRSFADAIERGIKRAHRTLENNTGGWTADQEVLVDKSRISGYRARVRVTLVLEG